MNANPVPDTADVPEAALTRVPEIEQASQYLKLSNVILISVVLCMATFCVAVDNTIISTAVPRITESFDSISDVGWYASIYPLMSCTFQPSYGKIYSIFSSKYVFLVALLIFEIGNIVCATAASSHTFIGGRSLAGLGSAGIQAGITLILAESMPLHKRPIWNSIIGSMFAVGSIAGPLLGGAFSDSTTWRWCFYINVPIGSMVIIFIVFFYTGSRSTDNSSKTLSLRGQIERFDLAGTCMFVTETVCLLLALSWGGTIYKWENARIIALLAIAGILFFLFYIIENRKKDKAIIPIRLLHSRSISAAILFGICLGGVFFVNVYYIPLWFQLVNRASAVESAILFIPFMLSVVGGFMFAGFGTAVTGYYTPFVYAGSILMSIGTGLLTTVQPHITSQAMWIGFQILCGVGIGFGEEQGIYMVQTILPEKDISTGIGIIFFAQTFGGTLFVSVAQTVFLVNISKALETLDPDLDPQSILNGASTGSAQTSSLEIQAVYAGAIKRVFLVGMVLATVSSLGALLYDWKNLKAKKEDGNNGSSNGLSGYDRGAEQKLQVQTEENE